MSEESQQDIESLERFVSDNEELIELEEKIGRFNVFDALRVARTEIRHSNFLAWLLDPHESHGHGDFFLKAVLVDMLRKARRSGFDPRISAVDIECGELHDVEIRREWSHIDLAIISHANRFAIVVENKVDSGEHSDQLGRYQAVVRREFPSFEYLFVFLTPDGRAATDRNWVSYSYADVHRVLTRVSKQPAGAIGGDVGVFLVHYLNLIESSLMDDPRIQELCRKIFATHGRALRLIWDTVGSPSSGVVRAMSEVLAQNEADWQLTGAGASVIYLCPRMWVGSLCTDKGVPLHPDLANLFCEAHAKPTSLHFRVVVGPSKDVERRKRLIATLVKEGNPFGFKMQRKDPTETWTRVWAKSVATWSDDGEPDLDEIADKFRATIHELLPRLLDVPSTALSSI